MCGFLANGPPLEQWHSECLLDPLIRVKRAPHAEADDPCEPH